MNEKTKDNDVITLEVETPTKKPVAPKGRTTISFHVTTEEKNTIVNEALDNYGFTVSDFIRYRLLEEKPKASIENKTDENENLNSEEIINGLFDDIEERDKEILNLKAQIKSFESMAEKTGLFIELDNDAFNMIVSMQEYRKTNSMLEIPITELFKKALYDFGDKEYWNNQFAKNNGFNYEDFEAIFKAPKKGFIL